LAWLDSPTAILALRNILFDGPKDKRANNKKVLGPIDGVNATFTTFEYRRTVAFNVATGVIGVFKNGVNINGFVSSDDTDSGIFTLSASGIPSNVSRDSLTATYYYQWFSDADLDQFLANASTWLGFSTTYINIPDGLNASCLRFAAQEAYEAAAAKYSTRISEVFQLEDAPSEDILKSIAAFKDMADNFLQKAVTMRDDFYKRQGQPLAPNFGFQLGRVTDPTPRR
jgi:hypothetical protein